LSRNSFETCKDMVRLKQGGVFKGWRDMIDSQRLTYIYLKVCRECFLLLSIHVCASTEH
jgi:hypothetical protein